MNGRVSRPWHSGGGTNTCETLRETWFKYNPEWTLVFWTDNPNNFDQGSIVVTNFDDLERLLLQPDHKKNIVVDVRTLQFKTRPTYNRMHNYGAKSDVLRYEIINRMGGLYVDTDFECLQPFDVLHHCCDFYTGIGCEPRYEIYNGLIASKPNNQILKTVIEGMNKRMGKDVTQVTGPWYFTEVIMKQLKNVPINERWIIFPMTYFYSWPYYEKNKRKRNQIEKWFTQESFAVHHWHVSWQ